MSKRPESPQGPMSLKQRTLGFASMKRTGSSTAGKNSALTKRPSLRDFTAKEQPVRHQRESSAEPIRNHSQTTNASPVLPPVGGQEDGRVAVAEPLPAKAELLENDPRWKKHHAFVKKKMGNAKAIHGEGQGMVHDILRVFDLSYEYGPCAGVTRLERWERASALGLNPPREVFEILRTRQGSEKSELVNPVLHGEI
ncbi:DNA polymerase delta, subunit 4-domain-containing protein [Infundibulicybe gibba]|nr:DNA polymerase delta, subunit 4-domain-containing protein [Infundibulicybe gibba]